MVEAVGGSWAAIWVCLLMAEGGFSVCLLPGTRTENVFGDQVAGFTALLLCLAVFPV